MKPVHCVVCAFLVFCVLDITRASDFSDIWRNLPYDFGNAVNNAWNIIIKAIKSPVRERKLGRRRKAATTTSTTMNSFEIMSTSYDIPTDVPIRPTIPIITQPKWNSLLDWRILQRPNLVKLAQEFSNRVSPSMYGREVNSYEGTTHKLTTNDEDSHFALLMNGIVTKIYTELGDPYNNVMFVLWVTEPYLSLLCEHYSIHKKINIPVLPTPKYSYDYLWRPKYTNQFVLVPYSTKNPASRALLTDETFNHFHSTQLVTTTEVTGSLLKELKIGKYRLKIFYKLFFD